MLIKDNTFTRHLFVCRCLVFPFSLLPRWKLPQLKFSTCSILQKNSQKRMSVQTSLPAWMVMSFTERSSEPTLKSLSWKPWFMVHTLVSHVPIWPWGRENLQPCPVFYLAKLTLLGKLNPPYHHHHLYIVLYQSSTTFTSPNMRLAFQVSVSPLDQSFERGESSAPVLNTVRLSGRSGRSTNTRSGYLVNIWSGQCIIISQVYVSSLTAGTDVIKPYLQQDWTLFWSEHISM